MAEPLDLSRAPVPDLLARCAFPPPGTSVTVAVSGGADSLALLVLASAAGCHVTAVHVDHGLRAGSAVEADLVAEVAGRCGAAFRSESVVVAAGPNLEARAREARLGVLPAGVLTGHTADDRAETLLLNLLRGAGPTGLAAMARDGRKPLLDLRRHDTEALCHALGLAPFQDPSNADPAHRRNRVRHDVLPLLTEIAERDVVPILVRQADLFAEVDQLVRASASALDPTDARALASAPRVVAGAALRSWLLAAGVGGGHPVDGAAIDRVLAVARGDVVAAEVPGGWRVARSGGRLSVAAPGACKDADHE